MEGLVLFDHQLKVKPKNVQTREDSESSTLSCTCAEGSDTITKIHLKFKLASL
jgi:hypothetical protein